MLPPIDPTVLSANPKFNALYSDLCNNKLNADGTSKLDAKAQKDRDALNEDLRKARFESAKRDLLKSGLYNLSFRPDVLPEHVQQLVAVVLALFEGQIAEQDKYLLQENLDRFKDNANQINAALAEQFRQDTKAISIIIDPDQPPPAEQIKASIEGLKGSISTSQSTLQASRLSLAHEVTKLHKLYQKVIESCIHVLEQTIHGSVARGTKAKADYLSLVAEGMGKKLNLQHGQLMSQLYSPEFQEALESKVRELQSEGRVVRRKVREAEESLEQYQNAGGMEDLAREYADILKETEKIKADIARIENGK